MMNTETKNIFRLLAARENRKLLVGLVALITLVLGSGVVVFLKNQDPNGSASASVNTNTVNVNEANVATGKESEEYLKQVRKYNEETLNELREKNPSAHPLPLNSKISAQSCSANQDAWIHCLRASDVLGYDQCSITDTQCMISKGLIEPGECAPGDVACKKLNGLNSGKYCDPADYECIVERARLAGCSPDDTQCLRENGIIAPNACAPGDEKCNTSSYSFCDINDLECIERRAAEAGCELDDTACLRRNGIISNVACAPKDTNCEPKPPICESNDLECIVKNARLAGCQIDDTECLIAAGIISQNSCSPADKDCLDALDSSHTFCAYDDLDCIRERAAKAGCDLDDTECLRKHGIISRVSCAPEDKQCKPKPPICDSNDIACIVEKARQAGCEVDDTDCLIAAGIIAKGTCSPADEKCNSSKALCSPDDIKCIERMAKVVGCEATDSKCLQAKGVIPPGTCVPNDPDCVSSSETLCDPNDMDCIIEQADKFGCSLSDTECMRKAGIIGVNDCAPADAKCRSRKSNVSSGGLTGSSVRDNRYARSANITGSGNSSMSDPAYMDQLLDFASNGVPSRKSQEIGFVSRGEKEDANANTEQVGNELNSSDIAGTSVETNPNTESKRFVPPLIKAGSVRYGVLDIALSTDYEGPVSITMVDPGPHYMSKLLGKMVTVENRVRLEMSRLVDAEGRIVQINAVALDTETTYAAVASRVNNHYIYRYGWWGVGTAFSAFGNAAKLAAEQSIIVPDAGVATNNTLDSKGEMTVALGELGEDVGEIMKERLSRKPTIETDAGEQVGIFFLDNVFKDEAL